MAVEVIFDFLQPYKNKFPNIEILYGLAIWNIFRAKTEAALANTILPAEDIFVRWKNDLIEKITRDSRYPKKRDTWNKIKTHWFSIEPGGRLPLTIVNSIPHCLFLQNFSLNIYSNFKSIFYTVIHNK
ncbi:hypothetical protein AYI69_g10599 [Smittium culicis]|uniref:Uncharacterized protein n=1 Tax=Smittium culicis TaxID=133412 RepID=A0A1R1X4M6_9FUNG|nr:hypothetical protein AYI69_g10599 [Smittium culicis]